MSALVTWFLGIEDSTDPGSSFLDHLCWWLSVILWISGTIFWANLYLTNRKQQSDRIAVIPYVRNTSAFQLCHAKRKLFVAVHYIVRAKFMWFFLLCYAIEYCRLYQHQVATNTAALARECRTATWYWPWSDDSCDRQQHIAALVHPAVEVNPLMVLVSLLCRPIHLVLSSLLACLNSQSYILQILLLCGVSFIIVILLLLICKYEVRSVLGHIGPSRGQHRSRYEHSRHSKFFSKDMQLKPPSPLKRASATR